jgi:hypothetical protein
MKTPTLKWKAAFVAAVSLTVPGVASAASADAPLFAANFWQGFVDHWSRAYKGQDAIVLTVLGVGAVGIFILSRSKWKK